MEAPVEELLSTSIFCYLQEHQAAYGQRCTWENVLLGMWKHWNILSHALNVL